MGDGAAGRGPVPPGRSRGRLVHRIGAQDAHADAHSEEHRRATRLTGQRRASTRYFTLVPTGPSAPAAAFARALREELSKSGPTLYLNAQELSTLGVLHDVARLPEGHPQWLRFSSWMEDEGPRGRALSGIGPLPLDHHSPTSPVGSRSSGHNENRIFRCSLDYPRQPWTCLILNLAGWDLAAIQAQPFSFFSKEGQLWHGALTFRIKSRSGTSCISWVAGVTTGQRRVVVEQVSDEETKNGHRLSSPPFGGVRIVS